MEIRPLQFGNVWQKESLVIHELARLDMRLSFGIDYYDLLLQFHVPLLLPNGFMEQWVLTMR